MEDLSKSNREWVSRLQDVVSVLNNERTILIGIKPVEAIKQTLIKQGSSQPVQDYEEKLLDDGLHISMNLVSWRASNTEAKEENDLLILFGQWTCIKSKIGTFKSINQTVAELDSNYRIHTPVCKLILLFLLCDNSVTMECSQSLEYSFIILIIINIEYFAQINDPSSMVSLWAGIHISLQCTEKTDI